MVCITHRLGTPNESLFSKIPNVLTDWADRPNKFCPAFFHFLEEPLIVQKQMIAQKKALILIFLEPEVNLILGCKELGI